MLGRTYTGFSFRGLGGEPALQWWPWSVQGQPLPDYYNAAYKIALDTGFSQPFNNVAGSSNVFIVNPDGTVSGTDSQGNLLGGYDPSFKPGPNFRAQVSVYSGAPIVAAYQTATQQQIDFAQNNQNAPVAQPITSTSSSPNIRLTGSTTVGSTFTVQISGAKPNSTVSATSVHNGITNAAQNFGTTDSYGSFSISGIFDASTVGSWIEDWTVGGVSVGRLTFNVNAPSTQGQSTAAITGSPDVPTSTHALTNTISNFSGSDFITGLEADFSPSQWGTVLGSGNLTQIVGLLAIPALLFAFTMFSHKGRR